MSRDLNLLNPKLKDLAEKLIQKAKDNGIPLGVSQTFRSIAEQNELYAQGRTKPGQKVTNAKGGYSYHNFGLAFDVFINRKGDEYNSTLINKVGKFGQQLGLEWGGSWASFKDTPHFQFTFGLSLAELRSGKKPAGGTGNNSSSNSNSNVILKIGSRGNDVKTLQSRLVILKYDINPDGIFGEKTDIAVKNLQRVSGLSVDGIVGPSTNKAILKAVGDSMIQVILRPGSTSVDVRTLQRKLLYIGYRITVIDSHFNENIENIIRLIQKNNGLAVDGIVGSNTYAVIHKMVEHTKRQTIKTGSTGNDVEILQKILLSRGYKITVNGKVDTITRNAILDFQKQTKLTADGIAGTNTWKSVIER